MNTSAHTAGRGGFNGRMHRQSTPISDDVLRQYAPSIFAKEAHESRSDRYTYIPTINVIEGLRREGFQPFMVAQGSSRVPGKEAFTKHMIRMRHASEIVDSEANEVILVNSHDGTSSYQLLSGLIRFACNNGLVCGENINDYRVPHKGDIVHQVIENAYRTLDGFGVIRDITEEMKALRLTRPEAEIFADMALSIKYDEEEAPAPFKSVELLRPKRMSDTDASLWTTFNVVQENIIRGGIAGRTANGRNTTTREVQSIDTNTKLNRALWTLAERMAQLKVAA